MLVTSNYSPSKNHNTILTDLDTKTVRSKYLYKLMWMYCTIVKLIHNIMQSNDLGNKNVLLIGNKIITPNS